MFAGGMRIPGIDVQTGVNHYLNWVDTGSNPEDLTPSYENKKNCMGMMKKGANTGRWRDIICDKTHALCEATAIQGEVLHLDDVASLV